MPDFLYNFIQLSPSKKNVSQAYENIFPMMLGVNLNFHIPKEISLHMQKVITDHEYLDQPRRKATIRSLIEKLKCDPSTHNVDYIKKILKLGTSTSRVKPNRFQQFQGLDLNLSVPIKTVKKLRSKVS